MQFEARVRAVAEFGFTERQARFLVTVMVHSGVCLLRQYSSFASIVHGQKTRKFFAKLVRLRYAFAYPCRHNRGRVYQVHHKALYRAIGETDSRHRRPLSPWRVVEGLMLLDAVLAEPELIWLATEDEKRAQLAALTDIPSDTLPHLTVGSGAAKTVRFFPDRVPIGIDLNGRWVFVYLVTHDRLDDFRAFLQRHADLFRTLQVWTIRIVIPPHLDALAERCQEVVRQEFAKPFPDLVNVLRWYFEQRRAASCEGTAIQDEERFYQARAAFRASWYQVLYRRWLSEGEAALELVSSRTIADAIERGIGRVECHVLPHQYRHLSLLVGSVSNTCKGAEEGEETGSQPRPLPPSISCASDDRPARSVDSQTSTCKASVL